jgi:7,8-dihydro-6-hydroxymethylpterin dimethyltransferase
MHLPLLNFFTSRKREKAEENLVYQPTTYCGSKINTVPLGLPKETESLCPECSRIVKGKLVEFNGDVWMEKHCPEHGDMKHFIFRDAELYKEVEKWTFGDGRGFSNPPVKDSVECPTDCGMCNLHVSHTGIGMVDLTNRCNLKCPICYANANVSGMVLEPSFEEVTQMLQRLRDLRPVPCEFVQFAGGEPTMHPRFFDILKKTKELGFKHIQCPTNGINFAKLDFARKAVECGLHTLYLQFDGLDDEIYLKTRGRKLVDFKLKAVENMRKAGGRVVLVPTVVKGINDHEIGKIMKYAIENADVLTGISFQPVCFSGRISKEELETRRYTLGDLAHDIEDQVNGLMQVKRDWVPLSSLVAFSKLHESLTGKPTINLSSHAHCSIGGFLFVDDDGNATAMNEFIDFKSMLVDIDRLATSSKKSRFKSYTKVKAYQTLKRHFNEEKAPKGLTWNRFLQSIDGYRSKSVARGKDWESYCYKTLFIAGMHFMDHYNYDVERVKRCLVHYSTQDGKLYPFCTYNAGPYFRETIEKKFQVSLADYQKNRKAEAGN